MNRFTKLRDEIALIEERHGAIFQLMEQINDCSDEALSENFKILALSMEKIFGCEQRLMENSGFPAIKSHLEQHARVLAAMHHVHREVMIGDLALARRVGSKLASEWFKVHTATLDQALFVWLACNKKTVLTQLLGHQNTHRQKNGAMHKSALINRGDYKNNPIGQN